jgi:CHASE3 domain sensor protein
MRLKVETKFVALYSGILLVFVPVTLFLLWNLESIVGDFREVVVENKALVREAYLLQKLIMDMETGQRGFIITGQEEFLEPYLRGAERIQNAGKTFSREFTRPSRGFDGSGEDTTSPDSVGGSRRGTGNLLEAPCE